MELRTRSTQALRCAYCHDDAWGGLLPCVDGCGAVAHAECWGQSKTCVTLGCIVGADRTLRRRFVEPALLNLWVVGSIFAVVVAIAFALPIAITSIGGEVPLRATVASWSILAMLLGVAGWLVA